MSTKFERRERAGTLVNSLIGCLTWAPTRRRPTTLPPGINYITGEWLVIELVCRQLLTGGNISIFSLRELEEILKKYTDHLFLQKLMD
jgi:hypothetical protein